MPRTFIIWYQGTIVVELLSCGASVVCLGFPGLRVYRLVSSVRAMLSDFLLSLFSFGISGSSSCFCQGCLVIGQKLSLCRVHKIHCMLLICLKVEEYQSLMMEFKHKIFWPRSLDLQNFTGLLQIPLSLKLLPWINYQKSASVEDLDKLNLLTLPSLFYL